MYNRFLFFLNDTSSSVLIYSEAILFLDSIALFKLSNKNTRQQCEICPKLK